MNRDEYRWYLIRDFFHARDRFHLIFRRYEERVLRLSRQMNVDRTKLRIPWERLRELIGFRSLSELQGAELDHLMWVSQKLFRTPDSTDKLDTLVAQIYHEVSILKEEHYTLKGDALAFDEEAYGRLFAEVSEYYPKRLRHIRTLFIKARRRLERIVPDLMEGPIVIRSIYLFADELFRRAYRDGLAGFYRKAYPNGGAVEGFLVVSTAFRQGRFDDLADQALDRARSALGEARESGSEIPDDVIGALIREVASQQEKAEAER